MAILLFISVLLISACGLIYELIAGTLASYLIGDSVFQFSTIIGSYLFAMGIGSALSRYIRSGLVHRFIWIELMVGLIGGFSSALLFLAFAYTQAFGLLMYTLVIVIGVLLGLEIPLLMRIVREKYDFRDTVAHVLTFDYIGALGASLLFPVLLVPKLGLVRSAMLFGIVNALVALWSTFLFGSELAKRTMLRAMSAIVLIALCAGMVNARKITAAAEDNIYADEIVFARDTRYQHIVLTRFKDDLRLFLNSHLQFSSRDEYRYHEALIHPGLSAVPVPRHVLVLGGGDGLAVREILKYPQVESITLVDLDPEMTKLFSTNPMLTALNKKSFLDPKVKVINADAFPWIDQSTESFDFIVIDFPDPTSYSLGKLYTTTFYRAVARHLSEQGFMVVQSTSPMFARDSFWCIAETLKQTGLKTYPYHVYVPSFGEWGFVLAGTHEYEAPTSLPQGLRFVSTATLPTLFQFPPDMAPMNVPANHLNDQVLVRMYDNDWKDISH
ncbi:Spermine synthase [Candidatus Koribacter versatilis Ellin345]|uniref:Polyamine aminopropyltransferase n=1 Tax=Koribacter versatilis (strain Ellin345) TaxID=204669 RepID=Q1IVI4_KORVE|nr:polyamine aminopropyltransferase [Candidatus Koribacter versatilis]ABF39116.1 Spermine synthase [Candidatus Koribacter versatilis Ellin345]